MDKNMVETLKEKVRNAQNTEERHEAINQILDKFMDGPKEETDSKLFERVDLKDFLLGYKEDLILIRKKNKDEKESLSLKRVDDLKRNGNLKSEGYVSVECIGDSTIKDVVKGNTYYFSKIELQPKDPNNPPTKRIVAGFLLVPIIVDGEITKLKQNIVSFEGDTYETTFKEI